MGMLGVLFGWLWRMAGNDPHRDPLRMLLYFAVMTTPQAMSEAGSTLVQIVSDFLVFGTALRMRAVFARTPRSSPKHFS
jgi:hypothetical protein